MSDLRAEVWASLLQGAGAADALALADRLADHPEAIAVVAEATGSDEPVLRAFAFHVLKQVATRQPDALTPFREQVLEIGREGEYWTIPLLSAQIAAHMHWPDEWRPRVRAVFEPYLTSGNRFAAACALRALWPIAEPGSDLQRVLLDACDRFLAQGGAPAASARFLLRRKEP